MNIFIEKYRGFNITFDTDSEVFSSALNDESIDKYRNSDSPCKSSKSFSAIKKFIDEFIKEHLEFEPFEAIHRPDEHLWDNNKQKIKIVGLRKDGRFVAEDRKGVTFQLASYDEDKYIVYNEKDDVHFATIAILELEAEEARKKVEKLKKKKIESVSLDEVRKKYQK